MAAVGSIYRKRIIGFSNESFLETIDDVDLNTTTAISLYTVEMGVSLIITKIVIYNASTSITTAQFGFGLNAGANDIIAHTSHTALVDSTIYKILTPTSGKTAVINDVLKIKCTVAQGSAATISIDLFGYFKW